MDSILYKIIEIEHLAQKITEDGIKAKRDLPKEIETEEKRLSEIIDNETNQKIKEFSAKEKDETARMLSKIANQQEEQIKKISELFSSNSKQWEKEIFDNIIGKK